MHRRILKDCKVANASVHVDALPVPHPLLGAIVQEQNYNPDTDPTWIGIRNGVEELFGAGDDDGAPLLVQHPVVVQPHVDLQQPPPNEPVAEPVAVEEPTVEEPVIDMLIVEKIVVSQPLDDVPVLDAALESGPSSRVVDKGKRIVEDSEAGMLTEKEYYRLVR
ncbi:hypothetical protein HanPSC8_Chr09g0361091 [Helianthus annuus]|nr:hypothetical protein HanPSC8_Chr09g0361091 [Helianthus annuus]